MDRPQKQFYEFGPFRLDVAERMLTCEGRQVQITMKAFDTLLALVRNSGRVVEKEKLLDSIWPNTFVEEGVLSVNIFTLRKALAEGDSSTSYIETVPRRGYRFVAAVKEVLDGLPDLSGDKSETAAETRSIAILPFKSLGSDEADEYLGFGIADALITRLGKIKGLAVRPSSFVREYGQSDQDAARIGRELMVAYVLEGSIRRSCERVRVTVQLVSVRDGSPMWAEKFDEEFTDIFTVEDRVSEQVAAALTLRLIGHSL